MEVLKEELPQTLWSWVASLIFASVVTGIGFFWIHRWHGSKKGRKREKPDEVEEMPSKKQPKKKPRKIQNPKEKMIVAKEKATQHPLYITTLKGFTHGVTCVSINRSGTMIVVSSSDSTLRVFIVSDPENPVESLQKQTYIRGSISGDYFTAVDLSVDDSYIFGATELSCKLIKLGRKDDRSEFEQSATAIHKNSVRWLTASRGRWIVTASLETDTEIKVFDYSLNLLASVDTKQLKNVHLGASPSDARFFGAAAWSPGVKVMEIASNSQSHEFKKLVKAMDLATPCGVNAIAFSCDNKKALLACKEGTLILWNIDVRYEVNEDPKQLLTVKEELTPDFKGYSQLNFSADDSIVIGIANRTIRLLKTEDLSVGSSAPL
ncbi:uncharacterized protein LOC129617191 [Condylostylus longicornis]|uniref:uncharacterized protein LOC129617191 n=1 Tax=Condylostylus longicornis TaxID=2530218 RepID=UPI00244E2F88|nr:uncharacterized protein LOC129617191 [Condylostylus longicornis]